MTLGEALERIRTEAAALNSGQMSDSMQDPSILIEVILPRCFELVARDAAKDPRHLNSLRKNHTISFTSGVGTLPESVKEEWAESIVFNTINSASDYQPGITTSYKKTFTDYALSSGNTYAACFTVIGRQIHYRAANTNPGNFTGNITVSAVTLPTVPASLATAIDIKDDLLEKVLTLASHVVANKVSLTSTDFTNATGTN